MNFLFFKKESQAFKSSDTSFEYLHQDKSDTRKSWRISVRVESQYSSENGYSGWPTPLKEKEEDSFIKSVMSLNQYYSMMRSGWAKTLNLQTRPSFSPDKHTRGVCSMCTRHLHIQSQHPHATFTPQWRVVWLVIIYMRAQDLAVTVAIISDTGVTSAPRWWKGAQWIN